MSVMNCYYCDAEIEGYYEYLQHTRFEHGSECVSCGRTFSPLRMNDKWSKLCIDCADWLSVNPYPITDLMRYSNIASDLGVGDTRLPLHRQEPPFEVPSHYIDGEFEPRNWSKK